MQNGQTACRFLRWKCGSRFNPLVSTYALVVRLRHDNSRICSDHARYSADGKIWTTLQYLDVASEAADDGSMRVFQGTLRVPYREQASYNKRSIEYSSRSDVAWGSDEEALVKDILVHDPKFFERSTPFIGYVQFLYEAATRWRPTVEKPANRHELVCQRHPSTADGRECMDGPWDCRLAFQGAVNGVRHARASRCETIFRSPHAAVAAQSRARRASVPSPDHPLPQPGHAPTYETRSSRRGQAASTRRRSLPSPTRR